MKRRSSCAVLRGTFVCYAISTFFLGYSGIIEVPDVDFKGQADRYSKPKITLEDVPRLSSVLQSSASAVPVDFDSTNDLISVAELVRGCYERANDLEADLTPEQLAAEAYDRAGDLLARDNIQEMVKQLDEGAGPELG